jgi:hypothetical protein
MVVRHFKSVQSMEKIIKNKIHISVHTNNRTINKIILTTCTTDFAILLQNVSELSRL